MLRLDADAGEEETSPGTMCLASHPPPPRLPVWTRHGARGTPLKGPSSSEQFLAANPNPAPRHEVTQGLIVHHAASASGSQCVRIDDQQRADFQVQHGWVDYKRNLRRGSPRGTHIK